MILNQVSLFTSCIWWILKCHRSSSLLACVIKIAGGNALLVTSLFIHLVPSFSTLQLCFVGTACHFLQATICKIEKKGNVRCCLLCMLIYTMFSCSQIGRAIRETWLDGFFSFPGKCKRENMHLNLVSDKFRLLHQRTACSPGDMPQVVTKHHYIARWNLWSASSMCKYKTRGKIAFLCFCFFNQALILLYVMKDTS